MGFENQNNYASKGLAGTALGLAIPGTVALANQLFNNNGMNGGLLGGLFGGNNNWMQQEWMQTQNSQLQSRVTGLEALLASNKNTSDVYVAMRNETQALGDRLLEKYINPMATEIANNKVEMARQDEQIKAMKENYDLKIQLETERLHRRIDNCCCETNGRINNLTNTVMAQGRILDSITNTVIPRTAICPEVMMRYNSWVAPTDTAPATQPVTGNIDVS